MCFDKASAGKANAGKAEATKPFKAAKIASTWAASEKPLKLLLSILLSSALAAKQASKQELTDYMDSFRPALVIMSRALNAEE